MGRSVLFCLQLFNSHPCWNFQHGAQLGVSTQASAWMLSPRQVCVGGSGLPRGTDKAVSQSSLDAGPKPPLHL